MQWLRAMESIGLPKVSWDWEGRRAGTVWAHLVNSEPFMAAEIDPSIVAHRAKNLWP